MDVVGPLVIPEDVLSRGASAATGNVCPVATPGTHSRRTGHKPKYIQYEDLRPARREHAPDAAP